MIKIVESCLQVDAAMVFANARALSEQGGRLLAQTGVPLTVDLGKVGKVDSSALAVIFAWSRSVSNVRGTENGQEISPLKIENPPAELMALAQLYGVDTLLKHPA